MKKVELYTSDTCVYCHSVKDYLNENNVQFIEHNISSDVEARKELIKKGYRSVPLIIIGDKEMLGFDKEKIDSMLKL